MLQSAPKISALLITFNEEDHITAALNTLKFADEILVIDAHSTDATVQIVRAHSQARLISHTFKNFSDQRNFAISQAAYDWILFLDADERITQKLEKEIRYNLIHEAQVIAYQFYRQFYFGNKPLYFTSFQRDKTFRLFHKDFAYYDPKKFVHESILVKGKTKVLKNKLDHFSFKDMESYRKKMLHYAQLRANELVQKGLEPNFFHFYIKPAYRFINMFVFRLGFLDGKPGFLISKAQAYGVKQRYIVLVKLKNS